MKKTETRVVKLDGRRNESLSRDYLRSRSDVEGWWGSKTPLKAQALVEIEGFWTQAGEQ